MKRKSILEKQSVKKKHPKESSKLWRVIRLVTSMSIKISLLLTGMISVSLLFLYLYQYLITSPHIKLDEVIVTGVGEGIKRELINMSELSMEVSLLTINLDELKKKVEKHPWIRSVYLEKRFPHTLIIRAEKEVPWALVALDKLSYMNRWGKIFKEVDRNDNMDYPIITGISKSGGNRDEQLKLTASILANFESETGSWSLKEFSELHFSKNGNLSLYSTSLPVEIKLGSGELKTKKGELKKIVKHLRKTGRIDMVRAIDLDCGNGAVVSFRKG
ncbi:cell division protein FtsQ/DivIB [Thermodesulfobacteriota bacterium]